MSATLVEPDVDHALPPIRRDRAVHVWVAAATVSVAGDAVFTLALAWTAVHLYSPSLAGLIVGAGTVPQALLTVLGGVLADRVDTRRLLIGGEAARALVLVAATVAWPVQHSAGLLLAVALAFGTVAGLTNPARGTLARQLVRDQDLPVLAGWTQIGVRLAQLSGAPLGALVVAAGGLAPAMLLDAVTFGATGLALTLVVRPRRALRAVVTESWRASLGELRRYLAADRTARTLTWGVCSLNVVVTPVESLGVALRVSDSHWPAGWVGAAAACCAVGAVAGSAVAMRLRQGRLAQRAFVALVVQGAALVAVGVDSRGTLLVAMTLLGVTAGLASVWLGSTFQACIAGRYLGRVTSVSQLGDQVAVPVTLPLFGLLAGHAGIGVATTDCGVAMAGWCAWAGSRRVIRTLRLPG